MFIILYKIIGICQKPKFTAVNLFNNSLANNKMFSTLKKINLNPYIVTFMYFIWILAEQIKSIKQQLIYTGYMQKRTI